MVHKNTFIALLFLLPSFLSAQFDIGSHTIGPSIGFSFLGSSVQLGINHEYGVSLEQLGLEKSGKLGIGGVFRYWSYSEEFSHVNWNYTDIVIGFQTNYHFYIANEKIDPWLGLVLAYDLGSVDEDIKIPGIEIEDKSYGGFWIAVNAGIRYWITENIAVNGRIGFGTLSYGALDIGFDYRIK